MPKNLENLFEEEVRKRGYGEKRHRGCKITVSLLLIIGIIGFTHWMFQSNSSTSTISSSDKTVNPISKPTSAPLPENYPSTSTINIADSISKLEEQINSISKLTPVALPKTGILKKHDLNKYENFGRLRIFLRAPLVNEKSTLPATCGTQKILEMKNENHRFIELVDWKSDKIITTAFIRGGDMVEIFVPLGSYKLRYAVGTQWYGEEAMFGSEYMYEMTEGFSSKTLRLDFTIKNPGGDIGAYCTNGNLGKKRIKKGMAKLSKGK